MRKELQEPIECLLRVYALREDLETAFPEVKIDGDMQGLIRWAIGDGSTIDSASAVISPVVDALKVLRTESDCVYDASIVCEFIHEQKGTIWDNSKEQYIVNGHKLYWETLEQVAKYQFERVSGDPNHDILDYIIHRIRRHFKRNDLKCAILGCDEMGGPELRLDATKKFSEIRVYDIAKGLLAKQARKLEVGNVGHIQYKHADLNTIDFGERSFDVFFSWGTIHHLENLDYLFSEMNRTLTSDGLFFLREFIGPKHIQYTEVQLRLANALLGLLPDSHKMTPAGIPKKEICSTPISEVVRIDPSEAISSHRIDETLNAHFDVVESRPTGGTLLHPLLHEIAWNFEKDDKGTELLKNLIELENTLLENDSIPSDYAFFVSKKKMESR